MRKRNRLEERLMACSDILISEPNLHKGRWREVFKNQNEIHVEIGCGKGKFIVEMAQKHPDKNFIAFEKVSNVIVLAMEKTKAQNLSNVLFISQDAKGLLDIFEEGEVSQIYLNFSDPWPKKRGEKHRLTNQAFLEIYKKILKPGGRIIFKTDNKTFFEYSLNSFIKAGLAFESITLDLHASGDEENITTEYEEKFASQNMPIYRAIVRI